MSGFGAFESNFTENDIGDQDPAAEFLAREQDELAGLEDEGYIGNNVNLDGVAGDFGGYNGVNEAVVSQLNGDSETAEPQAAPSRPQLPKIEPEKIRKWREEQRIRLEQKDEEESRKKDDLRDAAKKELDDWFKHYAEQVEKTKAQNRNAEREYVMERDSDVPGQEWERIAKLCDFNPKSSKHAKDVSRMRSIILQLKQQPPKKQ